MEELKSITDQIIYIKNKLKEFDEYKSQLDILEKEYKEIIKQEARRLENENC